VKALRTFFTALLLTAMITIAQSAAATGDASPAAFIQKLGNDAVKELTGPAIPQSERESRFR
jgi:hypothetical protein